MADYRKVADGMDVLIVRYNKIKKSANKAAADIIAKGVISAAPVRSGTLKRSIKVYVSGNVAIVAPDKTARRYAGYVHYGTKHKKAKPFFRQGFDRSKRQARDKYVGILKNVYSK